MQEFVPLIEDLDDEEVDEDFFEKKKRECRLIPEDSGVDKSFLDLPLVK